MYQDFFGTEGGEKPVGQDIAESDVTGPCVVLMPAPPNNQNVFGHVNMSIKVNLDLV